MCAHKYMNVHINSILYVSTAFPIKLNPKKERSYGSFLRMPFPLDGFAPNWAANTYGMVALMAGTSSPRLTCFPMPNRIPLALIVYSSLHAKNYTYLSPPNATFYKKKRRMVNTHEAKQTSTRGKGKYARMPLKSEGVQALVNVRKDVNPLILERRLQSLSPEDFKLFQKLAKISPSRARQMRKESSLETYQEWCLNKYRQMANEKGATYKTCSLKVLSDAFLKKFGFKRSAATLSRYVGPQLKSIKPAGGT